MGGGEEHGVEKIKLMDLLLFAFGGKEKDRKVIMKVLSENKHVTMKISDDMTFDIHETKEGTVKEYTPIAREKLDINEAKFKEMAFDVLRIAEPIDMEGKPQQSERILVMKSLDFAPLARNRKVEIESAEQVSEIMTVVDGVKSLDGMEFRVAIVFSNGVPKDVISGLGGRLYRVNIMKMIGIMSKYFGSGFVQQGIVKLKERIEVQQKTTEQPASS